jgi:hypothetical protein
VPLTPILLTIGLVVDLLQYHLLLITLLLLVVVLVDKVVAVLEDFVQL